MFWIDFINPHYNTRYGLDCIFSAWVSWGMSLHSWVQAAAVHCLLVAAASHEFQHSMSPACSVGDLLGLNPDWRQDMLLIYWPLCAGNSCRVGCCRSEELRHACQHPPLPVALPHTPWFSCSMIYWWRCYAYVLFCYCYSPLIITSDNYWFSEWGTCWKHIQHIQQFFLIFSLWFH